MSFRLSREHGASPLWALVVQRLGSQIKSGEYPPGHKLPSESDLGQVFGVSRPVVRQALAALEEQGFLYRMQGRGTFVAEPGMNSQLMAVAVGPDRDTMKYRSRLTTRVLVNERRPASAAIARELRIGPGAPVVHLHRARHLDGDPLAVLDSSLPEALVPGLADLDLTNESLYERLEDYGLRIARLRRSIGVGALPEDLAQLLDQPAGAPYLRVASSAVLADGAVVEVSVASYRGDKITLTTELAADDDGQSTIRRNR